jgi:nitrous oxidase accessory protein NosD/nitrous oxide reductase accessory protein NosL
VIHVKYVLAALFALLAVTATGFAVDPGAQRQVSAVPFDDTLRLGMAGVSVQETESAGYAVPRAEVFYSQYQYVVGYYGIESAATHVSAPDTGRQFGRPLAILVSDYSGTGPNLTGAGFVELSNDLAYGWVSASDAWFVVESGARTHGGPAVLPFSERADARAFTAEYGGRVLTWTELRARSSSGTVDAEQRFRELRENRTAWADEQVRETAGLADRPVSVVVGDGAPTLAAAVEQAPPNTTVRLPPGTYGGNLTIDESLTIAGAGPETTIRGPGTGTVLHVTAPRAAVTDLSVTGVGPNGSSSIADVGSDDWDARVRVAYGTGDSAIRFDNATGSLVANVHIDTQATGVLVRRSRGVVVRDSVVNGTAEPYDGFMGTLAMYDPIVVQNTTYRGGRDAVYTHRSQGIVIRDNRMTGMRYGVHEMYTSRALVANNTVRDTNTGIIVMTRPRENMLVGNDLHQNRQGLSVSGSASFVLDNVVTDNGRGIAIGATRSLIHGNVVVDNEVGIRADTLMPSNEVIGNDIVDNRRQVETGRGPIRIWSAERGNYWGQLPGSDRDGDGTLDQPYRPTGAVDGALLEAGGVVTLRESPAVALLRSVQNAVPGLRESGVVDNAPLVRPANPETLAATRTEDQ